MRKVKNITIVLSIGAIISFILGFVLSVEQFKSSFNNIVANRYIQYKMYRLIALSLQESLNNWMILTIIISFLLFIIWLLWKLLLPNIIEIHIKDKNRFRMLSACIACFIFFFYGGWAINHYWLPHRFHPISLLGDVIILLFTIFLGWTLIKVRWEIIALVLITPLAILNLGIVADSKINISKKPNLILIVCETLRADHLSCYGYKRDITENIDLFANNAYIFKNAYAQAPATRPSMWSIVTSRYRSIIPAKDEYLTIAEYFKSKNYRTAAFISQHLLERRRSNLHQGFDVYDSECEKDHHRLSARRAKSVTDAAIKWIEQNKKWSFFVWFVYFDPHDPYIPPDSFKGYYNKTKKFSGDRRAKGISRWRANNHLVTEEHKQFLINAYDEEIRYFDYEMGRLFSYLKRSGQYDNSIIILTADHGEELGDNGNRWGHCQILSQEEIWIPLLIKMPTQREKVVIEDVVQNIDIYPTLVEFLNKSHLPCYYDILEGKSLIPLLNRERLNGKRFAASFWRKQQCIIMGDYKYWIWGGKEYLINIKTKEEITNLTIRDKLRSYLNKIYRVYIKRKKNYYKKTVEDLKSLGYLQ